LNVICHNCYYDSRKIKERKLFLKSLSRNCAAARFAHRAAVFLAFGCVFAQSQGAAAMLPRSSVGFPSLASHFPRARTCRFAASNAKIQKSSLRAASQFLERLCAPRKLVFMPLSSATVCGMGAKKIVFITGTDTGVGKTLLTTLLLHHLRLSGCRALAMKPFCSGGREDVRMLQSVQPGELLDAEVNPFYFSAPVAPLVELEKTRRNVSLKQVVVKIRQVEKKCDRLLIEGSGGLMVPLGKGYLVEDLIAELDCRVIVVARNQLGTINHTLLTVARLRARGIERRNMVVALMGGPKKDVSSASNESILKRLLKPVLVVRVPNLERGDAKKLVGKLALGVAKRALKQLA
jgi:dethiobiotin synthetase